jgi:hypothetical protein
MKHVRISPVFCRPPLFDWINKKNVAKIQELLKQGRDTYEISNWNQSFNSLHYAIKRKYIPAI